MVDFNAPPVKAGLQQHERVGPQIGGQQLGEPPAILAAVFAGAIAHRCHQQQTDRPGGCVTQPRPEAGELQKP
jgi:hypothetical protein